MLESVKLKFDLEQAMLQAWSTKEDIDLIVESLLEREMTKDQLANALMGLSQIHQLRGEKMFNLFERICNG